jgi:hypothetical protein
MAALLWQMTDQPGTTATSGAEEDARMRVSIRSLLRPIPADDGTWQVDFFHRSVMEYFLAAAIAQALADGDPSPVRTILNGNTLSTETMDFVVQRLPAESRQAAVDRLVTLALSARRDSGQTSLLGGNAVSLCYLISGGLPDADWRGLNLSTGSAWRVPTCAAVTCPGLRCGTPTLTTLTCAARTCRTRT